MKAKLLIIALLMLSGFAITSCASSKGGCKMTQNYVGYGR